MDNQLHIPVEGGACFAVLHEPASPCRGGILLCGPLFEEHKTSQRAMVELGRSLAATGYRALRLDYTGCGDSPGDFADATVTRWVADITTAATWLSGRVGGGPVGMFGLRFGAALAIQALAAGLEVQWLALWEPMLSGEAMVQEELRKKLMKEMLTFGGSRQSREQLLAGLDRGDRLDADGYAISPDLYRQLRQVGLPAACPVLPGRVLITSLTPGGSASRTAVEAGDWFESQGAAVTARAVRHQPFWKLIGSVDCRELIADTRDWVAALPPATNAAAVGPTAEDELPLPVADPGEEPLALRVGDQSLLAVLHRPAGDGTPKAGIVFCHGWSGSRLGPHRMFVKMARRLAAQGFHCLRLDFRGRGNSEGATAEASIEAMSVDAGVALDYLASQPGVAGLYLLGICSGGKVAIESAVGRADLAGLILWSAEALGSLRSDATDQRKTQHAIGVYIRKLCRWQTWRKLLTGKVNVKAVNKAVFQHEARSEAEALREDKVLRRFQEFDQPLVFIYGSNDPDTDLAGENYRKFCEKHRITSTFHAVEGANHSFYSLAWETDVMNRTEQWLLDQHNRNASNEARDRKPCP